MEVARAVRADLDLSRDLDPARAADRLAALLRQHRGVRSAELIIRKPGKDDVVRMQYGPYGPETTFDVVDYSFPGQASSEVVGDGDDRAVRVELPVKDSFGHPVAAIRLETSLSEAEKLGRSQALIFVASTALAALLVFVAFTLVLNRVLVRPLSALAGSVSAIESGDLDGASIPGASRRDEIGTLARGLDAMLGRVRGFNRELQDRVEEATADLARKNRELAELNDLLVEARRERSAQERLAALGQLSGTIAHELGNPLNAISGHVQLLARDAACPPPVREQLRVVEGEVQRMTSIIRRFLDSARALVPRPEPVQLGALVDEALSLNVSAEARARIEVLRDVPPDLGPASIDPSLVRHVLGNFISNAVDAMPVGGSLTVRARRTGDQLALSVADTGGGIGADARKHIFEPFFTTKEAGKGTGLGLAISREIAGALRGRIEVETAPGAGSTFTLLFPAPPSAPPAPPR
ncbi:MAG TPA: ATP-binding protein [Anaeromyxobacteraceae bacterium]|nr:ATP-binding protein [Anaeromyxobacteraceae bacterium]